MSDITVNVLVSLGILISAIGVDVKSAADDFAKFNTPQQFGRWDRNGDGFVDNREFQGAADYLGVQVAEDDLKTVQTYFADNNGKLDAEGEHFIAIIKNVLWNRSR